MGFEDSPRARGRRLSGTKRRVAMSKAGQCTVTIPAEIAAAYNMRKGTIVEFKIVQGDIVLRIVGRDVA